MPYDAYSIGLERINMQWENCWVMSVFWNSSYFFTVNFISFKSFSFFYSYKQSHRHSRKSCNWEHENLPKRMRKFFFSFFSLSLKICTFSISCAALERDDWMYACRSKKFLAFKTFFLIQKEALIFFVCRIGKWKIQQMEFTWKYSFQEEARMWVFYFFNTDIMYKYQARIKI